MRPYKPAFEDQAYHDGLTEALLGINKGFQAPVGHEDKNRKKVALTSSGSARMRKLTAKNQGGGK